MTSVASTAPAKARMATTAKTLRSIYSPHVLVLSLFFFFFFFFFFLKKKKKKKKKNNKKRSKASENNKGSETQSEGNETKGCGCQAQERQGHPRRSPDDRDGRQRPHGLHGLLHARRVPHLHQQHQGGCILSCRQEAIKT